MIIYYFIFLFLTFLAWREIYNPQKLSIYNYIFLTIFFSFFIGLRYKIGCDWAGYYDLFYREDPNRGLAELSTLDYLNYKEIGFTSLNFLINRIGGNFYHLNLIFSLLFILPLLKFCSEMKRPFLAILVSFPYLITVIGLGVVRQSIAIVFIMLCINQLNNFKFSLYYFYNLLAIIFHKSSIFFLFLPLIIDSKGNRKIKNTKIFLYIALLLTIILLILFKYDFLMQQINGYLYFSNPTKPINSLIIWGMSAVPAIIFLFRYKYFEIYDLNKIWRNYAFIAIFAVFIILINTTVAQRIFLYLIPINIYFACKLPEINLFNLSKKRSYFILIIISFLILSIWLNFANHAYCYVPYKNLLFK